MGQYASYNDQFLDRKLRDIEKEIISLKAIQKYDPSQLNYSYQSNRVNIPSYLISPNTPNYGHYGILATLIFTSKLPNVFPRVSFDYEGSGLLITQRTEYWSKNQTRVLIYMVDTLVPMAPPYQFTINAFVYSNTVGTLTLEKTYVLPSLS